jgi:hypothetical protein
LLGLTFKYGAELHLGAVVVSAMRSDGVRRDPLLDVAHAISHAAANSKERRALATVPHLDERDHSEPADRAQLVGVDRAVEFRRISATCGRRAWRHAVIVGGMLSPEKE